MKEGRNTATKEGRLKKKMRERSKEDEGRKTTKGR